MQQIVGVFDKRLENEVVRVEPEQSRAGWSRRRGKRRKDLGRVLTGEDWRRSASLFFVRQFNLTLKD